MKILLKLWGDNMRKKYKVAWILNNILTAIILALNIFIEDKIYSVGYLILIMAIWLLESRLIKKRFLEEREFIDKSVQIIFPIFLIIMFVLDMIYP